MQIKLIKLLDRIERARGSRPSCGEVAERTEIASATIRQICSHPRKPLTVDELDRLVDYLFAELRPHTDKGTHDRALRDQIRFELIEFPTRSGLSIR